MLLKKTIIIILFIFLTGYSLTAQQNLTLNQCISYAIENNINIQDYTIQEKLALEDLHQSKRNLLPGISASTSAGISYGRSIDPISNDYITREFFNNSYRIGMSITVFDGFRLQNQIKYQKFRKQLSEYNQLNAVDDLAFQVMTAFFDVIYYEKMLLIANEQVETSLLDLKTTEKNVEVGLKAKTDLLEMRSNLEMEELNRIQIANRKKTAMLQLMQYMNFSSDEEPVLISEEEPTLQNSNFSAQNLFPAFTSWSPYYQSLETNLEATEKVLSLSRSNLVPSISAGGSINTAFSETNKESSGGIIPFENQFKNNQSKYFGFSVSIPVFNRWNNRSEITKAKLEIEKAKNGLESGKQKLYFEVANNVNELEALTKEINQFEKQQEADNLSFQAATKKFDQGLINVLEYYLAKNRLANTNSQLLRAKLQWGIKMKTVEFYKGQRFWESEESLQSQ